jgi:hypothetical protein
VLAFVLLCRHTGRDEFDRAANADQASQVGARLTHLRPGIEVSIGFAIHDPRGGVL